MKKKKINIPLILIFFVIIVIGIVVLINRKTGNVNVPVKEKNIDEFINCIMHRGGYSEGYHSIVYVFLENGEYYYFPPQYDGMVTEKAHKGKWKIEDNKIRADIQKAIYLEGGEVVDITEEDKYINSTKIVNGNLVQKEFLTTLFIEFENNKDVEGAEYKRYLEIKDDTSYYPIYKYNSVEEVKEKLKEIYGEIFTLLEQ